MRGTRRAGSGPEPSTGAAAAQRDALAAERYGATFAPMRVIVADDHACVRVGVAGLLHASARMTVVAEAHDARSLASQLDRHPCDAVVSDLCMPGVDGEYTALALLRRLSCAPSRPAIVVLTMLERAPILAGLMQLGITSLVSKRDTPLALIPALDAAWRGEPFLSARLHDAFARAGERCAPRAGAPSACEWAVFRLYAQGMPIHRIAARLGRSPKTISAQKRSAMRKLGLETECDLVEFAMQIGLT